MSGKWTLSGNFVPWRRFNFLLHSCCFLIKIIRRVFFSPHHTLPIDLIFNHLKGISSSTFIGFITHFGPSQVNRGDWKRSVGIYTVFKYNANTKLTRFIIENIYICLLNWNLTNRVEWHIHQTNVLLTGI